MGKYTNIFNTIEEYNTYMNGDPFLPSLCLIDGSGIIYDKRKAIKSITINGYITGETNNDSANFNVNCDADIPKTVTLEVNGSAFTSSIDSAGTANFTVNNITGDNIIVEATCPDDWHYQSGTTSVSTTFQNPLLGVRAVDISVGKTEVVIVTVPPDTTGEEISCLLNGAKYTATIINSKAKVLIPDLPAGKYTVVVYYEGNDKYCSKTGKDSFAVGKS